MKTTEFDNDLFIEKIRPIVDVDDRSIGQENELL